MKKIDKNTMNIINDYIGKNKLKKAVVRDIIADSKDYDGDTLKDRLLARLDDVSHGCSSGIVSSLIYYSDTTKFFERHRADIIALVKETADACGETAGAFLSQLHGWEDDDPFCDDVYNKNTLAWFAYEEIATQLTGVLDS